MNRIPRLATRVAAPAVLGLALVLSGCSSPGGETEETAPSESAAPAETAAEEEGSGTSSRDEIVDGFPTDLIPEYPDSTMQANSAEPTGDLLAVNLTSSSNASEKEILDFYTSELEDRDFEAIGDSQQDGDTTSLSFQRGDGAETLALTISPNPQAEGERLISIGGNVQASEGEAEPEASEEPSPDE